MAKDEEQKRRDYKSGKQFGLSGREMFSFNPALATDNDLEDEEDAYVTYEREDDDDEQVTEYKELDLEALALDAQEVHFIFVSLLIDKFRTKIFLNITIIIHI